MTTQPTNLLKSVLRENAVFSWLSGTVLAIGGASLDTWIGVNQWILIALGVGLIGYGVLVWRGASSADTLALTGRTAVAGDLGWIVGAVALIVATDVLTTNGETALLLISVPVALFLVGQVLGLRRMTPGSPALT